MIIPITKSNDPSRCYIVNSVKKVSVGKKLLRFLVRYLIPTTIIAGSFIAIDLYMLSKSYYETKDLVVLIGAIICTSILAAMLSNLWFRFITKNEDRYKE